MRTLLMILYCMFLMQVSNGAVPHANEDSWYGGYTCIFQNPLDDAVFGESVYFTLQLDNTHQYSIAISRSVTDNRVLDAIISGGTFQIKRDTLFCTDFVCRYTLTAVKEGDSIRFLSGFRFLLSHLVNKVDSESFTRSILDNIKIPDYKAILDQAKNIPNYSGIYLAIKPGVYSDPLHRLILYSDYRYRWDILNQKISEGTWSQQGYIITFIDSSLDFPFHAIMDSHGLRSMLLPGDYQGTVLKK